MVFILIQGSPAKMELTKNVCFLQKFDVCVGYKSTKRLFNQDSSLENEQQGCIDCLHLVWGDLIACLFKALARPATFLLFCCKPLIVLHFGQGYFHWNNHSC